MDRESKDMGFKPGQPLTPYDNLEGLNALSKLGFPIYSFEAIKAMPNPFWFSKKPVVLILGHRIWRGTLKTPG